MKTQKEIAESLERFSLPEYREIPDVGLYLDQVVKYINSFLKEYPQMQVTGSMLSNYVKMKLIPKAVKKAYSRDQICMMFFIVLAKRSLSIEQAGKALALLSETYDPETYYRLFREELKERFASITAGEAKKESETDPLLNSITSAVAHCMYLDQYFAEENEDA